MAETQKRLHAIISGRVQGVSFRYYTTLKANELGIVGWVMNRQDGKVEVVAEGTQADLETLETWLHEGSPAAVVTDVSATQKTATGEFSKFKTMYNLS